MDKKDGYLEFERRNPGYRPVAERIKNFDVIEKRLSEKDIIQQAQRCMDCGTPFCCGTGCPIRHLIPEFNEMLAEGRWRDALELVSENSSFPEFTAAICPAPCEESCVLNINDDPVTIRQIEREVIETGFERGWVEPRPPQTRNGFKVAVVGSGPAGLAAAQKLNRAGCEVTVYEQAESIGGLLRYGIPDYKLPKWMIDRRLDLMREEGVRFESSTSIGHDISCGYMRDKFDAICLTGGARDPRDIQVPGRDSNGVHFAMDFLVQQNKLIAGEDIEGEPISAAGKRVVVIGGGDTGSDCIGTSLRQGAVSVHQLEIMPKPPPRAEVENAWPWWPNVLRESSSQAEGCERMWSVSTKEFVGNALGDVESLRCGLVDLNCSGERPVFVERAGSDFEIEADLVLLAMGFEGPLRSDLGNMLELKRDDRGNIWTNEHNLSSLEGVFCAGDMNSGQSLVVRAMNDGQKAATNILNYLKRPV